MSIGRELTKVEEVCHVNTNRINRPVRCSYCPLSQLLSVGSYERGRPELRSEKGCIHLNEMNHVMEVIHEVHA